MNEKVIAVKRAEAQGHKMGKWKTDDYELAINHTCYCKKCGRFMQVRELLMTGQIGNVVIEGDAQDKPCKVPMYGTYSYDVWGNAKDGYEVNAVFGPEEIVPIPYNLDGKELTRYLKKIGVFNHHVQPRFVEYSGDDRTLYVEYKGRPDCEFRLEEA